VHCARIQLDDLADSSVEVTPNQSTSVNLNMIEVVKDIAKYIKDKLKIEQTL